MITAMRAVILGDLYTTGSCNNNDNDDDDDGVKQQKRTGKKHVFV